MSDVVTPGKDLILKNSDVVLKDINDRIRLRIDSAAGSIFGYDATGRMLFHMHVENAALFLGGEQAQDGDLVLFPRAVVGGVPTKDVARASVHLDGGRGVAVLGGGGVDGGMVLRDKAAVQTIFLSAADATLIGGRAGRSGRLLLQDDQGKPVVTLDAAKGNLTLGRAGGGDGDLQLLNTAGVPTIHLDAAGGVAREDTAVYLDGAAAVFRIGGNQAAGRIVVRDGRGRTSVTTGAGSEGGGSVRLQDASGKLMVDIRSDEGDGRIRLANASGDTTVEISGENGDVELMGADCAEEFEVEAGQDGLPGTVLVIAGERRLRPCDRAYDRRVAGIVSGGGTLKPGIVLGRRAGHGGVPVALAGRVYCRVDASAAAIEVGDLLTTSATPGHAMKALDARRAFGATVGKALAPMASGLGCIPVLVALH